ncbi:unnamed protein product [Dracunculus medinensis]|uniref:Nudix hydrolase domain-containing protein n=1 Tax=Dracunculus medinensis TaxID=318479 RepID=A0A0N4UL18_DRAME|nr:unnamed protein product [Dracunculus medinensis]
MILSETKTFQRLTTALSLQSDKRRVILLSGQPYLRSNVYRIDVPDAKIYWSVLFPSYSPPDYTDPSLSGKSWADGPISLNSSFKWNSLDGSVDRLSYIQLSMFYFFLYFCYFLYLLVFDGRPLNPMGRTGLRGRGVLGRWGPNHAADPIVSRYFKGHLQFIGIQRSDTGEWAIPGGMIDPGEMVSHTLKREFTEEVLDGIDDKRLNSFWEKGVELYRGYVDDPRNTDNSWMETIVVNFHDHDGILKDMQLKAGSDAINVRWIEISANEKFYASHGDFIRLLADHHKIPI